MNNDVFYKLQQVKQSTRNANFKEKGAIILPSSVAHCGCRQCLAGSLLARKQKSKREKMVKFLAHNSHIDEAELDRRIAAYSCSLMKSIVTLRQYGIYTGLSRTREKFSCDALELIFAAMELIDEIEKGEIQ